VCVRVVVCVWEGIAGAQDREGQIPGEHGKWETPSNPGRSSVSSEGGGGEMSQTGVGA